MRRCNCRHVRIFRKQAHTHICAQRFILSGMSCVDARRATQKNRRLEKKKRSCSCVRVAKGIKLSLEFHSVENAAMSRAHDDLRLLRRWNCNLSHTECIIYLSFFFFADTNIKESSKQRSPAYTFGGR